MQVSLISGLTAVVLVLGAATGLPAQDAGFVPVDEEISEAEVLALVDRDYPGLEAFAAAMEAGEQQRARDLLIGHFAAREHPTVPPPSFPGLGSGNSMIVLQGSGADAATADEKWLNHIFTIRNNDTGQLETYELGEQIDWLNTPSDGFSWGLYLNQLNIVSKLAGVYRDTGDEKYAVEIGDLLVSWTQQVPRGYGYTRNGEMIDSGMEVRNRLCNAIAAYDVVRASPSFTPETHMAFLKLLITANRELMSYAGTAYPGLIPAAVMFPEFTEASQWLDEGMDDIYRQLVDHTTPDGARDTHSISYQTVPIPWAARSLEFIEANAEGSERYDRLAKTIQQQGGKIVEFMLRITMPNGGLPNIGDTYGRADWSAGAFLRSLDWWLALTLDAPERERLKAIEDPFDRLRAVVAIMQDSETDEPARASEGLPGSGYYIMRSSWDPDDARYLLFSLSAQAKGHAHNDATHFDLYAHGKPLLADAGDYFLGWGYRTALHNAIEIDGRQQARGHDAPMIPREWLSTPGYDLVDGAHGAFGHLSVTQRRKIVFVKPEYFVLFDLLTGDGEHTAEQFFHFAGPDQQSPAEVRLDERTLAAASTHADTANVQVIPTITEDLDAGFVEAVETEMRPEDKMTREAMLGWRVTGGTYQRVKSPVLVYTREAPLPQAFGNVLFPTPAGTEAEVAVESLPVTAEDGASSADSAAGLVIRADLDFPAHDPEDLVPDLGENLALGAEASAEVSSGTIAADASRLTDGDPGAQTISAAVSSGPVQGDVALTGRFAVRLADPAEINCVVLHHGTWNGSRMLYPPEEMTVQTREGDEWIDVTNQRLTWRDDYVTEVHFDPVTTTEVSVAVERPSGGRVSMREFEVHHVAAEEIARVEALRAERATETFTDTLLISHDGPGARRYGDFTFDGEMALLREDEAGRIIQLSIHRGSSLSRGDEVILASDHLLDTLTATWQGDTVILDCVSPRGLTLTAQGAATVAHDGAPVASETAGGLLRTAAADGPAPIISDLRVERHPPQEDLAGGQPWAEVTWTTDRPATTQVQFSSADGPVRRTILDRALTREHSARVEFLLPGEEYAFTAVSVDADGRRAEAQGE